MQWRAALSVGVSPATAAITINESKIFFLNFVFFDGHLPAKLTPMIHQSC